MSSETFTFTGAEQTWTVPDGVDQVTIECWGAEGGNGGGNGVYAKAEGVTVAPGDTLYVYVGGAGGQPTAGWPSGGTGGAGGSNGPDGGGGGGATDVRKGGNTVSDRIVVAGGGGGDGGSAGGFGGSGGAGGYQQGNDGSAGGDDDIYVGGGGGTGGTQSSGGTGGDGGNGAPTGSGGAQPAGGAGGDGENGAPGGGGAGGGFYGGGGGQGGQQTAGAGGAGGGSSTVAVAASSTSFSTGAQTGDGQVTITYEAQPDNLQATTVSGDQVDLTWEDTFDAEDGFNIYRAETSGGDTTADYTQVDSVGANATSYSDTGLEDGEQYFYRVTATDSDGFGESNTSNEDSATTSLPAPTIDSLDDSVEDEITVAYTLADDSSDGDVLVERSTDGGSTWSTAATVTDLSATSVTDTGRDDGTQYTYRVTRRTDHVETQSGTAAATTVAPAPTLGSLSVTGDVITASGTDTGDSELRHEIEVRRAGSGDAFAQSGSDIAAVSGDGNAISGDTAALLDGEQYDVRLRTVYPDASATSTSSTATTDLPDEDAPVLGNGVEDEVAVDRESQVSDYGDIRLQIRETGETSWDANATGFAEQTVDHATLTATFVGREDGEEYEVRARTETEHATGAWTSPVAIVTKFPGASNLTATATGRTSVDLSWTDNADNEAGFRVERREQHDDGTTTTWETLADRDPNTTAYTDDTLLPGTTYDYRVEAYTDDATALSNVDSATTDDPRFSSAPKRSTGWYIEIDHPSGETLTPEIVGDPTANPRLRDKPTLTVEVAGEGWRTDALERQSVRAWQDGIRAPVETLTDISETPRGYGLVCEGGDELDVYVERYVDSQETYALAEELIANNTGLTPNVDDPASETTPDVLQRDVSTESEWTSVLLNAITASDIYEVTSTGELQTRQTAYFLEAEDMSYQNGSEVFTQQEDRWSGFTAIEFDGAGLATRLFETVTTDHTIPADNVRVAFRTERDIADHPGFAVQINGETITQIPADFFQNDTGPTWFNVTGYSTDLPAGEHTVELDFNEPPSGDGAILVDCVVLFDDRVDPAYSNSFPEAGSVECNEYPSGSDVKIETDDVDTVRQIVAGRLEASINNTGDGQALEISNDRGANWVSASNAASVEGAFASGSTTIRARFSLGGYDADPTASPAGRTAPQQISSFQLFADVNDTPLTQDTLLEGRLGDILSDLGRDADAIWEFQIAQDGTRSLEWTQPGLRTASADEALTDWEVREDYEVVKQAIVRGESRSVRDESITLQHGVLLGLEEDYIRPATERVAATDGTVYERGTDYTMDYVEGAIEALASGNIADGEDVLVDYEHQIRGRYTSADYSGPSEKRKFTFPNASSQNACEQLALTLVKDLSEPRVTATVEIDSGPRSWSLVDAVSFAGVPLEGGAEVFDVADQPGGAVLELGSRPPIEEAVEDLRTQVSNLSETA